VTSEYERFLFLHAAFPSHEVVPSKSVDLLWHAHILSTRDYFADCERMFGAYLHHAPSFGEGGKEALGMQFGKMQEKYEEIFGKMDPAIWPQSKANDANAKTNAAVAVVACGSGSCGSGSCNGSCSDTQPAAIAACGSGSCNGSCSDTQPAAIAACGSGSCNGSCGGSKP
jgi:hypothetical protein